MEVLVIDLHLIIDVTRVMSVYTMEEKIFKRRIHSREGFD